MTQARRQQISLEETPFYHCVARCVRRAFLCGEDQLTGKSYDHRKQWIVDKIKELASVFAIDVCAYAVMSNQHHVVLRVDRERAAHWDDETVIERWRKLFTGGLLIERYVEGEQQTAAERDRVSELAAQWRDRLSDISWFMRCLNENIARQANREDHCKGRFWEGRFKSQALLDEAALLACMVYVDLNPIRAGTSETPESSDFTAIQERIVAYSETPDRCGQQHNSASDIPKSSASVTPSQVNTTDQSDSIRPPLLHFSGGINDDESNPGIPFSFTDYLELTDWTGRAIRDDKRGHIPEEAPPILQRLGLDETHWVETVQHYGRRFYTYVGHIEKLRQLGHSLGRKWLRGTGPSRIFYATTEGRI